MTLAANHTTPFLHAKQYVASLSQSHWMLCFISFNSMTTWSVESDAAYSLTGSSLTTSALSSLSPFTLSYWEVSLSIIVSSSLVSLFSPVLFNSPFYSFSLDFSLLFAKIFFHDLSLKMVQPLTSWSGSSFILLFDMSLSSPPSFSSNAPSPIYWPWMLDCRYAEVCLVAPDAVSWSFSLELFIVVLTFCRPSSPDTQSRSLTSMLNLFVCFRGGVSDYCLFTSLFVLLWLSIFFNLLFL